MCRNLLQETISMIIGVETKDRRVYTGRVKEIDDYMNVFLEDVEIDSEEGIQYVEDIVIRGTSIRYIKLPDILKYSLTID